MKDFFSAFGSEFFRPLATLLLPGALALTPATIVAYSRMCDFRKFANANHAETTAALVVLAFFLGLILEDGGSHIECGLDNLFVPWEAARRSGTSMPWHRRIAALFKETPGSQSETEWFNYLRLAFKLEPVGHRYMRTLVLRLKFELGCCAACPAAMTSVLLWKTTWTWRLVTFVLFGFCCVYFYWEAWTTTLALKRLRHEMLEGIKVMPDCAV